MNRAAGRWTALERAGLAIAFAVLAGFALAYTWITPIGGAPDELAHLGYVHGIAYHLQLPPAGQQERQQPPLFYLVGAAVLRVTGDPHAVRLVSTVVALGTAWLIFLTARRLFPRRRLIAVGATGLFALLPEVQYLAGGVSNETVAWLAGSLCVYLSVDALLRPDMTRRRALAVGVAIGVALLSKESDWFLALLLAIVVIVRHHRSLRAADYAVAAVMPLLIGGWWIGRNIVKFHALTPPLNSLGGTHLLTSLSQVRGYVSQMALSIIGMYGGSIHLQPVSVLGRRDLPSIIPELLGAAALILVAVTVVPRVRRGGPAARRVFVYALIVSVATVAQVVLNSILVNDQPQARYLLVAAAIGFPALAWSLARIRDRLALGTLVAVVAAAGLVLDVSGLITASRLPV